MVRKSAPASMRISFPESPAAMHLSRGMPNSVLTYSKALSLPPFTVKRKRESIALCNYLFGLKGLEECIIMSHAEDNEDLPLRYDDERVSWLT